MVVRGRGFRDFVPLGAVQRCAWGADEVSGTRQLTRARVLSDTRLECVSYLRRSPASVPFGIALNGLDFMEEASAVSYTFYEQLPLFRGLEPTGGPLEGGTRVTLHGAGFGRFDSDAASARCIWGAANRLPEDRVLTVPSELGSDYAVCESAQVDDITPFFYASVKLALNGLEYSTPQFFRFYGHPKQFIELVPVNGGPIAGGSVITLGGYGFRNFDEEATALAKARCRWGDDEPGGTNVPLALEADNVVCETAARATPGEVELAVSLNGADFVGTGQRFLFYNVSLDAIEPRGSPIGGRAAVTLIGSGFRSFIPTDPNELTVNIVAAERRVKVRLGGGPALAVSELADDSLVFDAPAAAAGEYVVSLALNGVDWDVSAGEAPLTYTYYAAGQQALIPSGGLTRGGTLVTVVGAGFLSLDAADDDALAGGDAQGLAESQSALEVRVGDPAAPQVLVPTNVSDSQLTFVAPPRSASTQLVAISLNGHDVMPGAAPFLYYEHSVGTLHPTGGPVLGGTLVTVNGFAFDAFNGDPNTLRCRFGVWGDVAALSLEPTHALCRAPPFDEMRQATPTGSGEMGSGDGDANAPGVLPLEGRLAEAELEVALNGRDFMRSPLLDCAGANASCDAGPGARVAQFHYYETHVSRIEPSGGFVDGGTPVTVFGSGFLAHSGLRDDTHVSFGARTMRVLELRKDRLVVESPALPLDVNALANTSSNASSNVSSNASSNASSSASSNASMNGGSSDGGGAAGAAGAGATSGPTNARLRDAQMVPVALSLNQLDYEPAPPGVESSASHFYRYYDHYIDALQPRGGPSLGGTSLTVIGGGFGSFDGLGASARCRFGGQEVTAEQLILDFSSANSSTPPLLALMCETPRSNYTSRELGGAAAPPPPPLSSELNGSAADGSAAVALSWSAPLMVALNGLDFRGDASFRYYDQVLTKVHAVASIEIDFGGPVAGGYEITLRGEGFDGYDGNASTVRVRFGDATDGVTSHALASAPNASANASADATASPLVDASDNASVDLLASASANASAAVSIVSIPATEIVVTPLSLTPTEIVVIAPNVSLDEGAIITERAYPCWNPPCRRVLLSLALNGVDFLGGLDVDGVPVDVEFIYTTGDPWRFFNLLESEFHLYLYGLATAIGVNAVVSWIMRVKLYRRYLRCKYWVLNKTIYR